MQLPNRFPFLKRSEVVDLCRAWAKEIQDRQIDFENQNLTLAIIVIDELTYPIRHQPWIEKPYNYDIKEVVLAANSLILEHTDIEAWEELFDLIDDLEPIDNSADISQFFMPPKESGSKINASINKRKDKLHRYARNEVIKHCKEWAENARFEYLELVTGEKIKAQNSAERLAYPISSQEWVDWSNEPELSEIIRLTEEIGQNHTNPAKWEKIIKLIDNL